MFDPAGERLLSVPLGGRPVRVAFSPDGSGTLAAALSSAGSVALVDRQGRVRRTAVGGVSYDKQLRDLAKGVDVLVATPGRLGDLIERGSCALTEIDITVLDEADQMADMGFLPDVTALLEQTPEGGQRLLFSATLDGDVDHLVKKYLIDPVHHEVESDQPTVDLMEHRFFRVHQMDKVNVAASIIGGADRCLVFVRTKRGADRLVQKLDRQKVRAVAMHGNKSQSQRRRALASFERGDCDTLL